MSEGGPGARLRGRVALITGAARGIGAASAEAFASAGAATALADILIPEGERLAARLQERGARARFLRLDVARESGWETAVRRTVAEFGALHVLVNNAGIGPTDDIEQETVNGWNRVLATCETSVWLGIRAVVPSLRAAGGGSIVNVGSVYAFSGGFGDAAGYHAAKAAVGAITRNAAVRYAPDGIRVNTVHPGFIDTAMGERTKRTAREAEIIGATPLGRRGRPEEVASAILFLASEESSFITGADLVVDGGWLAR